MRGLEELVKDNHYLPDNNGAGSIFKIRVILEIVNTGLGGLDKNRFRLGSFRVGFKPFDFTKPTHVVNFLKYLLLLVLEPMNKATVHCKI